MSSRCRICAAPGSATRSVGFRTTCLGLRRSRACLTCSATSVMSSAAIASAVQGSRESQAQLASLVAGTSSAPNRHGREPSTPLLPPNTANPPHLATPLACSQHATLRFLTSLLPTIANLRYSASQPLPPHPPTCGEHASLCFLMSLLPPLVDCVGDLKAAKGGEWRALLWWVGAPPGWLSSVGRQPFWRPNEQRSSWGLLSDARKQRVRTTQAGAMAIVPAGARAASMHLVDGMLCHMLRPVH